MPDGAQELDVVQHPTLGELKFPKDMPFEERNQSIERLENQSDPSKTLSLVSDQGRRPSPQPTALRGMGNRIPEYATENVEARAPGSTQPLRQEQGLASNLANLAGIFTGDAPMGMPEAPSVLDLAGGAKEAMKAGVSRAMREPGRFTADPSVPPTRGALKPWTKTGVGPFNLSKFADTLAPAREPIVQPISHSPNYGLIRAGARAAARPPVEAPPMPTGLSTSPESVAALPQEALPGIARGVMSSTGAMPEFQIGKPPTEPVDPVAAAIKRGLASKVPTRMPKAAGAAIKQGIASASEPRSTGSEGRPATWTNEAVTKMAGQGNRDAITQAIRRGLGLPENARYVMGDADFPRAVLNPREVTKFTPEGTPIRNADNPLAQNPSSRAQIAAMAKGVMSSTGAQPATPFRTPPDAAAIEAGVKRSIANPSGRLVLTPDEAQSQQIMRGIAKQRASESPTAEPQTPGGMVTRAPRSKAVPDAKQYPSDIIDQAEGEMRGALELGNTMPQAGRYFAENSFEEHPLAGRYDIKAGERPGGTWSGISSQKGNIAGQYPWFNDPDISLSKLTSAIQQGKGALYERIVGKIAEGITKERGAATAAISEQIPQLRELAGQVQEVEPELAQAWNDLADGKIGLAPDKLRAYVTEKISDATTANQFAQAIDDAAAEPRSPGVSETHATVPPARPGSGEAGPATQAPELSTKPPGSVKPISFNETEGSGSHIGAIEPRPLRPGEKLDNPPRTSNQPTYNKDEAARYRKWISGLKRT